MSENQQETKRVMQLLISFTTYFPDAKKEIWVTAQEMRDRLVHAGVHSSLTVEILTNALHRYNRRDKFMKKRREGDKSYFHPSSISSVEELVPKDQRYRKASGYSSVRLLILPDRNCLRSHSPDVSDMLNIVNEWLRHRRQHTRVVTPCHSIVRDTANEETGGESCGITHDTFDVEETFGEGLDEDESSDGEMECNYSISSANFDDVENNEGNGIFNLKQLNTFVHVATTHAAICGAAEHRLGWDILFVSHTLDTTAADLVYPYH
jgi:hypothetical protein